MRDQTLFDKIDLHLIRVLHTVLTERSVSRAAIRLGMHQPAVSASLKRLRDFAGDPLAGAFRLRHGAYRRRLAHDRAQCQHSCVPPRCCSPTHAALSPATGHPHLPGGRQRLPRPLFLPQLVAQIKAAGAALPHRDPAAVGRLRLPGPPGAGRGGSSSATGQAAGRPASGPLFDDEVVCLVARATTRRCAPRLGPGAGWRPNMSRPHPPTRAPRRDRRAPGLPGSAAQHHRALPAFRPDPEHGGINLAGADHGRQYCERYRRRLPVKILPCPVPFRACCITSSGMNAPTRPRRALAARAGQVGGGIASKRVANNDR
jgi:hypothetical protein